MSNSALSNKTDTQKTPVSPTTASGRKKIISTAKGTLTTMAMGVLLITSILSLRGLPSEAKYGVQSIFFFVFAALVFLVPFSLVCAELASTYTRSGGLYRWVAEAFGPKWGWTAMYLEWQTIVFWFPTVLMFGAASLAYIAWPESFDQALASNKIYTLVVAMLLYWGATFNAFRGQKSANKLSTYGGMVGTIIPGALLIVLGALYFLLGKTNNLADMPFFPDFSHFNTLVLAASIFLFFAGMETQAVHINDMANPAKQFPKAVFFACIAIVTLYTAGTLVIGLVVPADNINLLQSLLVAYKALWKSFDLSWLGNITALFVMFGVAGQISALVTGPSTGLMAVAQSGYLPMSLQKVNSKGVNKSILYIEGFLVSALSCVMIVLPTVESAYQIMSQMATIIYLIMVVIIYLAFIRLRRTAPGRTRGFKVPGGKAGEAIVCGLGISGAVLAMVLSFLPPAQITTGSPVVYVTIIAVGVAIFVALPLVVYSLRKPSWRNPDAHFYPFYWQIEGRKPWEISKWSAGYEPTETEVETAEACAIRDHASAKHC